MVNVQALNFLLRSEIFVSEDGQLRAAPLILDYEPLSHAFVEVGQAVRAGSPRLAVLKSLNRASLLRETYHQSNLPFSAFSKR